MAVSVPIIILLCLFAYRAPSLAGAGITDPDYYWHVGYGEWILAHGRLPESDFWTWTFEGVLRQDVDLTKALITRSGCARFRRFAY